MKKKKKPCNMDGPRRYHATTTTKSLQSGPTLWYPIDGSPRGSPVPRILQARTLEWAAISFSNVWKWKVKVKSLSCVRLFGTPWIAAYQADCSLPGASIHGIFQARVLEWGAIASLLSEWNKSDKESKYWWFHLLMKSLKKKKARKKQQDTYWYRVNWWLGGGK